MRALRWFRKALGYALGALVLAFAVLQMWFFLHILYWKYWSPASTSFMSARLDQLREKNPRADLKYIWVDYPRISGQLKRAIVAAEDMKFVDHEGFDWEGIQRALEKNQKKGKAVAGGSSKHHAIRAALAGGWIDTLVTDTGTAEFLLSGPGPAPRAELPGRHSDQ